MPTEQPELPFRAPAAPAAGPERLAALIEVLQGRGWCNARALLRLGFGDRELRALVQADTAGDIFSYPGSPGYKLFADVTLDEFRRADALKTQGRAMVHRWLRYQRRLHRCGQTAK